MNLLSLLDAASSSPNGLRTADSAEESSWAEVWASSARMAGAVDRLLGARRAVGTMLTASLGAAVCVPAVLRGGRDLVSLPMPSRGMSLEAYGADLLTICAQTGAEVLVADADVVALVEAGGLRERLHVVTFDELLRAGGPPGADRPGGRLVQFTSGSTARPKGIPLTVEQLGAAASAIVDRAGLDRTTPCSSWVPLSHDMGLIGCLLSVWSAGAAVELGSPQMFLARPLSWLESWSRTGAYVTGTPNFALDLVSRALERHGLPANSDLSRMRSVSCGGEMVRASTLERFAAAAAPYGFSEQALAPGYGMAEAVLAVSMLGPDERWASVRVDAVSLADGELVPSDDPASTVELVGAGRQLDGYSVTGGQLDSSSGQLGELMVDGPAVFDGYIGGPRRSGAHRSGDLGAVASGGPLDGQVVVAGRLDDMLSVRGTNLYAVELEASLLQVEGLRPGCAVCVPDGDGGYLVVAESAHESVRRDVAREARAVLSKTAHVAPSAVWFVPSGTVPKTSSGKKQRSKLTAAVLAGAIDVEEEVAFKRTS